MRNAPTRCLPEGQWVREACERSRQRSAEAVSLEVHL
jgi:hypothetical protein